MNKKENSIRHLSVLLIIIIFLIFTSASAQDSLEYFSKEITASDYRVMLNANSGTFFTGSIELIDKYNNSVLYVDNLYSGYNSETLIDLNGDGREELILDLGTGVNMYDYNMFLIFDFVPDIPVISEVHNAELATTKNNEPRVLSYVRMSPAVLGAGYIYSLKYENGKLMLDTNSGQSSVMKDQDSDGSEILDMINEYSKEADECSEESLITNYYLSFILQQKILGDEDKGWTFFDKFYKCRDKEQVKANLKNDTKIIYDYINNPDNNKFNSIRN